jgi:hypothetical protein
LLDNAQRLRRVGDIWYLKVDGRSNIGMIKFTCDCCGKDISEKIHSSIRQFYPIDHFKKETGENVELGHFPEAGGAAEYEAHQVFLNVCLFDEFSKLMHARAWDISSARIHCSQCAVKNARRANKRVMTIFTKIEGTSRGESTSADSPRPW